MFAFAAAGHADELSDIQAQSKQLREQNQALMKRLSDLEKRQEKLEKQPTQAAAPRINPTDAMAADLPYKAYVKAPAPVNDDICWKGVCVYGAFDMGVGYQQHGSGYSPYSANPNAYLIQKQNAGSYFGVTGNGMSVSFVGIRGKQEIADGLYGVFNLQAAFNPASGMGDNGLSSITQNNGLGGNLSAQNAFGDSSRNGQMFATAAYFGIDSPTYGAFTMGRQSALLRDGTINYDPLGGAQAFSLIGTSGTNAGGGSTENSILDNTYKYAVGIGPVRLAAMIGARNGSNGSAPGNSYFGDVGFDYMGFSVDFTGGKIFDSVGTVTTPLTSAQMNTAYAAGFSTGSNGFISGTVSDNTVFQVGAKYTIGPWKFYGGYEYIRLENPNNPLAPGAIEQGAVLVLTNNTNFNVAKIAQTGWVGVKYAITRDLDVAGGAYHLWQNNFTSTAATAQACAVNTNQSAQCNGAQDMVSVLLDWRFAKHVDLYGGLAWARVSGGFSNGYAAAATNNSNTATNPLGPNKASSYNPTVGLRYQF
ncbi:porin [Bradyrhizobium sp. dw_411]|uniref:porin n=1 Tax=Bradyrhizobium sp. dw_411 TaxID=2720082 RepID=UPI001BCABE57|nr:porin [Bradyrhizobium sp. dw_411]